jgi:hypothetical protein
MFIAHAAAALAGKRAAPRTSLGWLLAAATLPDLVWPLLLLLGWERVGIDPGNTAFTPLDFVSYPISHSLVAVLGWALLLGGAYYAFTRYGYGAVTLGVLVLSHWLLDWISHRPDLPLWPGGPRVGLGMWHSPPLTVAAELVCYGMGLAIYLGTTRRRRGGGWLPFASLAAGYLVLYAAVIAGQAPPSARAVAFAGVAAWLFPLWAWWADRGREVTPQIPETAYGAVSEPAG